MVYRILKKTGRTSTHTRIGTSFENQQIAEELIKLITGFFVFKEKKVCLSIKGKIWDADLADIELIRQCNEGI